MSLTSYHDPIAVFASFNGSRVQPVSFIWGGREWRVKKVNMVHYEREGRAKLTFFSVSDDANAFKICFNSESLGWTLEEVWSE